METHQSMNAGYSASVYSAVSAAACYLHLCKACLSENALNETFKRLRV